MDPRDIQKYLDAFSQDSQAAMAQIPVKRDIQGRTVEPVTAFSIEDIRTQRFVTERDLYRRKFSTLVDGTIISLENILPGRAPIQNNDRPENLVDTFTHKTLAAIDSAGLQNAALEREPWSDDYWPYYLGSLGRRYADPQFPSSKKWETNYEYVRSRPAAALIHTGDPRYINMLSPAEKYDILVGDGNFGLTTAMWNEGRKYALRTGEVETWMGICHGWAPASYMLPSPSRKITVLAADGRTHLHFYPSDIKSLASLLWASAKTVTKFVGGRSNDKNPATDASGRLISQNVFDTNPATFHLALANQIGVSRRSFIIDVTYDYEVWNQPIYSYKFLYFNPQTMTYVDTRDEATVPYAQFTNDRFRKYRRNNIASVTGVVARVNYVVETSPSHRETDIDPGFALRQVDYFYDLESAQDGTITGGEWYQNTHPDFLWTPPPGARALTPADSYASGSWTPHTPLPQTWRRAAWQASPYQMPLAVIVEALIRLANNG